VYIHIVVLIVLMMVCFLLGLLLAWWYGRQQLEASEKRVNNLLASLNQKEKQTRGLITQAEVLEAAKHDLSTQLAGREQVAGQLEAQVREQATQIRALEAQLEASRAEIVARAQEPDDLARIEGIGPKISQLLRQAGIRTFAQLASSGVDRLQQILDQAELRLADPGTWPEQAKLAAASDWGALEALQEQLKGGRRQ
jgi:predicted flap endonuclease-1-like 5' DNA nuclease